MCVRLVDSKLWVSTKVSRVYLCVDIDKKFSVEITTRGFYVKPTNTHYGNCPTNLIFCQNKKICIPESNSEHVRYIRVYRQVKLKENFDSPLPYKPL